MADPVLVLEGVKKSFGSVSALENMSLAAYPGEMHAIVGDNGAGKSTAIKIITGVHSADEGELRLLGEALPHRRSPAHLGDHGIAVVYQDLALVECLDIATNLSLGRLPTRFGILDRKRMRREAGAVLADLKVRVTDVDTPVGLLSGGQRQIIAIARAVRLDKPLVLLDEPTAALGVQETAHVGEIIEELKPTGKAVVCVSHDLDFVFRHADRITVLRLGTTVGTRLVAQTTRSEIVGMITGAVAADGAAE
ncbi:ATP-binding cassette domain-containing protein (plasmid) [Embleya sp. NBC_00888]|uniref:ATP-binding cassette domain-containing protein n=1 Tax=Embleya sp. NBC_00888 TaxID=2975960 RepID=UPI002F909A4D|nr:ATP-binding cassette domain-containing protein [Embleya sp. NBC_00888]